MEKTKRKVGRPKKTLGNNPEKPKSTHKRGRGRPRKNPIKESVNLAIDFEIPESIPDLIDIIKEPESISGWGSKAERTKGRRKGSCGKENREEWSCPSSMEESESKSEAWEWELESRLEGWVPGMVIPGPIPDFGDLLRDQTLFLKPDYFSDLPDDWDLLP